jgi:hypothetical protein
MITLSQLQKDLLVETLRSDGQLVLASSGDDESYAAFEERVNAVKRPAHAGLMGFREDKQLTFERRGSHRVVANLSVEGRTEAERLAAERGGR